MKKTFVLILTTLLTISILYANEGISNPLNMTPEQMQAKIQREKAFEKKLALTEIQKQKAREMRVKGHEKIKPVMDEIIAKKQEAKMVKMSRIAVEVQEERLAEIDRELKILNKKAHDIRKANMKDFESILTNEQKKILKQMKKEGRKRYHAEHPCSKHAITPPNFK